MFDTIESVTKQFTTAVTKLEALAVKHGKNAEFSSQIAAAAVESANAESEKQAQALKLAANINKLLS